MRITPLDVRKQEFRRVVRGCDADEVKGFLSTVADEYEAVLRDNKQLRERILSIEEKVGEYENIEKTLRDTLMTAERVLSETKDGARREGELIVQEAEMRARQTLDSFRQEADVLRREILTLQREKESFLARFRSLAEAQITFVENHQVDVQEMDRRLMNISDHVAAGPTPRPEAVIEPAQPATIVETTPSPPVAMATPRSRSRSEHDEWRNYSPGKDSVEEQTAVADGAAETGSVPTPAPENVEEKAEEIVNIAKEEGENVEADDGSAETRFEELEEEKVAVGVTDSSADSGQMDRKQFTRGLGSM